MLILFAAIVVPIYHLGFEFGYEHDHGHGVHIHQNAFTASGTWWKDPLDSPGFPVTTMRDSTHIWVGTLPTKLPAGSHLLEVRTEDAYGKVFVDKRPFRIR